MVWAEKEIGELVAAADKSKLFIEDFHFGGDYLKAASFVFFLRLAVAQKPQDWRRWPLDTPLTYTFREGFHFWPTPTGSELGQA